MRVRRGIGLLVLMAASVVPAAHAQEACKPGPSALGVSRTIQVDTSAGPRFGFQYKEQDLLAEGEVVLTFDDGPMRAYTRSILETLSAHCAKAIFFMVGRMALADPAMVKEVAARGHTVATHTWSHANLQALTPLKARAEIELGFSAVQQALGEPIAPFFRFPYLRDSTYSSIHLQGRGIGIFSIDVDSKDYLTRDAATVHQRVMGQLAHRRRGIILFHDIHASTARALPGLLAEMKAKGYKIVHLQPKAAATTLADFDASVQQDAARRTAGTPLSKRSMTWSAASAPPPAAPLPPSAGGKAPRPVARGGEDDWLINIWRW
jgi:peptidoglycan/xylan/chitin deacetylase (PgdA/CDA1 family)